MKTFTELKNMFTDLSNNTSSANDTRGGKYINDQHRYLLQKYFDNERSFQTTTVGGQSLILTGALTTGATTATLNASWAYPTSTQLVTFSNSDQRTVLFTNGSTAISWTGGLSSAATTAISSVGMQAYRIPANVSKLINDTVQIGQLKYKLTPVMTRAEWDMINFLPYTSDIPNYYYIYNGFLEIFPIPASTGNIIQFNYKTRVPDLTFADFSTGNIANGGATAGGIAVTGSATTWNSVGGFPLNVDLSFYNLNLKINPPYGDGLYYPISKFTSDTALTLANPIINAPNITASSTYVIGQIPLLQEDFHDMLVYGALMIYFSSIVKDKEEYTKYKDLYTDRLNMLDAYAGTKSVNVDLEGEPQNSNPNLFLYGKN